MTMPIALHLTVLMGALQVRFRTSAVALDASFLRLGRQLDKRRGEARALEAASRAYPVVTFMDDAVEAWLDRSQHRNFSPKVQKGLGEELAEGGRGFVRGIARIPETIEATRIIPAVLASLAGVLESAGRFLASTRRGMTVRERLIKMADAFAKSPDDPGFFAALLDFAPRLPRIAAAAVVVLGTLARFLRTLGSNRGAALRTLAGGAESMAGRLGPVVEELFGSSKKNASNPGRLEDTLRSVVEGLGVALLALPGLVLYLGPLLGKLGLGLRLAVVEAFARLEAEDAWSLRKDVLTLFFVHFESLRRKAVRWLTGASDLVLSYLVFGLRFGELYLAAMLDGIQKVMTPIILVLAAITALITVVGDVLTAIFDLDLLAGILPIGGVSLSLGDFLEAVFEGKSEGVRAVEGVLATAMKEVSPKYLPVIGWLLSMLRTGSKPLSLPADPPPPRITPFPGLLPELWGKTKKGLKASFVEARNLTTTLVADILSAGQELLVGVEREFDQLREHAATQNLTGRFQNLIATASRQSSDLLLIEHFWQATHDEPTGFERMAGIFEKTLVNGGFYVVGFAIQGFVEQLDAFWRAEKQAEADAPVIAGKAAPPPTSPHLLARRARLGTVRVERVALRARGRGLDDDLKRQVAERVQRAVSQIYQDGRARLAAAPAAG